MWIAVVPFLFSLLLPSVWVVDIVRGSVVCLRSLLLSFQKPDNAGTEKHAESTWRGAVRGRAAPRARRSVGMADAPNLRRFADRTSNGGRPARSEILGMSPPQLPE
jgi:hypothetical protein